MNNIIEKKLLLSNIYKKYLKRYSNYKNFLILDDNNEINRVLYNKNIKEGNFILVQNYFINIKSTHVYNIRLVLQSNYLINTVNKKKMIIWNKFNCKFGKLIIIKSTLRGYFCSFKGVFIYCNNQFLKKQYIIKNITKLVSKIPTFKLLINKKILNRLFLLNRQQKRIKKCFRSKLVIKHIFQIKRNKKKKKKIIPRRSNIYFLGIKQSNLKLNNYRKLRIKFKIS